MVCQLSLPELSTHALLIRFVRSDVWYRRERLLKSSSPNDSWNSLVVSRSLTELARLRLDRHSYQTASMNGAWGPLERFFNLIRFEWWRRTAQPPNQGLRVTYGSEDRQSQQATGTDPP